MTGIEILVTIIVPVYNAGKYLKECLDSLVSQTYASLEIICVNDGSTDRSSEILKEYAEKDGRIKAFDKENGGYGSAVNFGLEKAKGDYIAIVEPDDFLDATMYEKLVSGLKHHHHDIVKCGYYEFFDLDNRKEKIARLGMNRKTGYIFNIGDNHRILRIHPSVWSCIYKRSFLDSKKIRMKEVKGAGWVDNPFMFETVCQAETIYWVNEPLYFYRQTADNSSNLKDCSIPLDRMKDIYEIIERVCPNDKEAIFEADKRLLLYVGKIDRNFNTRSEDREKATKLISQIDSKEWKRFSYNEIKIYNKYLGHKENSAEKLILKAKRLKGSIVSRIRSLTNRIKSSYKRRGFFRSVRFVLKKDSEVITLPEKDSRTRVLFVPSDNKKTSGAFISMVYLIKNLRYKYNIDPFVILPNNGNGEELLKDNGISYAYVRSSDWVVPLNIKSDLRFYLNVLRKIRYNRTAIKRIEDLIKQNGIDLVHINTSYSYVAAVAAERTGIPFVWHIREFLEEDQGNTLWDREKGYRVMNKATKVIAISQSIFEKMSAHIDSDRLELVYNGIDAKKFYMPEKQILKEKPILIYVGGFEKYKGQVEFSKAVASINSRIKGDFEIWFVGTGKAEVRDETERIFTEAGMISKVRYLGYRKDVENCFALSDISFTCAGAEAFGRTTVEAMLCGNLVIGADTAGTKELIINGETGYLYKSGDYKNLAEILLKALENKEESRKLAAAGRSYMMDNMTAEINADNVYGVYEKILRKVHSDH